MSFDRLWAGWRASYVSSSGALAGAVLLDGAPGCDNATVTPVTSEVTAGDRPCVFCAIASSSAPDSQRHVVWSSETIIALLNAYPYASGHMLVMPRRHVAELEDLTREDAAGLWGVVQDAVAAVKSAYRPDGLNLGVNLGRAAGAGIPAHLHVHVVPRWSGDTNFMTATAETRVLPEALSVSWQRIRSAWDS